MGRIVAWSWSWLLPAVVAPASAGPAGGDTASAEAGPLAYTLDPDRSALYVQVLKDPRTIGSSVSHDHVVAATGWSGEVTWDPADPSACAVRIVVPVSGLRPDEDALRRRVGYDRKLGDRQRAQIGEDMRGERQLDAARFPTITFVARRCEAADAGVRVTGDLTIHGTTRPVSAVFEVAADREGFSAAGTFTARATDFGFEPYSALLGALRNRDEMTFTVDVRGAPQAEGASGS